LTFLPAPFREDPESADFLDRFLSLQDTFFAEALARFDQMGAILRPMATPPGFLDWLGGWFDWTFLAEWDQATRRQMIASSMRFFQRRGTMGGLAQMLRWHIGAAGDFPVILENYRMADYLATPLDGGPRPLWIGGHQISPGTGAHQFTVILPQDAAPTEAARAQIDRIITAQKPAHTVHCTLYVAPRARLGAQSLLGIDAILADTRPKPLGQGLLDEMQTNAVC
jgi:phage tail-like protein